MNQAIRRIFCSVMVTLLVLTACAPAPTEAENQSVVQLQQTVDALSAAQNTQSTPDMRLNELQQQIEGIAAQQKALSDALLTPNATATVNTTPQLSATSDPTAPTIFKVEPEQGETYGETEVTITGTNFSTDENTMTFWFGENKATIVECTSTEVCLVVSPKAANEVVESTVNVKAERNQIPSNQDRTFKYLVAPTVDSVQPDSGPIRGGTVVTITGANFSTVPTSKTIFKFNDIEARILDCAPPTVCRVVSPGIPNNGQDVVAWVQAVNSSNNAKSQRVTSADTGQAFRYVATESRYACDALLLAPKNKALVKAGEGFRIRWLVKNIGTNTWPAGQDVRYSGGINMGEISFMEIGHALRPNETVEISFDATAPTATGLQYMTWAVAGQGCSLYVAIRVE